jgi:glycosyltransferase involved in cell wall biosynthesis
MSNDKIFIGIKEISDLILQLSEALDELGYDVTTVVLRQADHARFPHGDNKYSDHDRYIRKFEDSLQSKITHIGDVTSEFIRNLINNDSFIFVYSSSFYYSLLYSDRLQSLAGTDLQVLQALNKNIGVIANGDDHRSYTRFVDELEEAGLDTLAESWRKDLADIIEAQGHNEEINKMRAKMAAKYSNVIFTRRTRAQFLSEYEPLWVPLNIVDFEFNNQQSEPPQVIHAPSQRTIKGTRYITEAVRTLKNEGYEFAFELVENVPNYQFRKRLVDSDIVIDQVLLPAYGFLGVESMATGNAVLSSAGLDFNRYPDSLPIKPCTPKTVQENLRELLENPKERERRAQQGRSYVEKYHDRQTVAKEMLNKLDIARYDNTPY